MLVVEMRLWCNTIYTVHVIDIQGCKICGNVIFINKRELKKIAKMILFQLLFEVVGTLILLEIS